MSVDPPSVLVVDDEAAIADLYAGWLADDYAVTTATCGAGAVDRASEAAVEEHHVDRRMPGLSGEETLARLRANGCEARVATVTAVDAGSDAVGTPVDPSLRKPVVRERLLATVEDLLALSSYDDAVRTYFALAETRAAVASGGGRGPLRPPTGRWRRSRPWSVAPAGRRSTPSPGSTTRRRPPRSPG